MLLSRLPGVVAILTVALLPWALPCLILSPNLAYVRRVDLQLQVEPTGVMATQRSWGLFGERRLQRYGPVVSAGNEFLRIVETIQIPVRNDVVSVLVLRTPAGTYHPFGEMRASRQPSAMRSISAEVIQMSAAINEFVGHPTAVPLRLSRSDSYPLGFFIYDAIGLAAAAVIARYWTMPLCRAAARRLSGAPPQRAAEPFLDILGHIVDLAAWLARRRQPRR